MVGHQEAVSGRSTLPMKRLPSHAESGEPTSGPRAVTTEQWIVVIPRIPLHRPRRQLNPYPWRRLTRANSLPGWKRSSRPPCTPVFVGECSPGCAAPSSASSPRSTVRSPSSRRAYRAYDQGRRDDRQGRVPGTFTARRRRPRSRARVEQRPGGASPRARPRGPGPLRRRRRCGSLRCRGRAVRPHLPPPRRR